MIWFTRPSNTIVIIVGDFDVQVLTWDKRNLSHHALLTDTPADRRIFSRFLLDHPNWPVVIIADLIEESFRHESSVHVSAADQKAILARKLNYAFRGNGFSSARITSRATDGRRDDHIMLSALTRPELVKPWIDLLLKRKMAIQGISSVAFLLESSYGSREMRGTEHLLVVSLDEGATLRQTYLRNGNALLSRQTTLLPHENVIPGADIYQETLHIRKYLERIRLLPFDGKLRVQVYASMDKQQLLRELKPTDLSKFECYDTREEANRRGLRSNGQKVHSTAYFAARLLRIKRPPNIYAPFEVRRFFELKQAARRTMLASFAVLAVAAVISAPSLLSALDRWDQTRAMQSRTAALQREYEQLTERFPDTPIPSKQMELVVKTSELIDRQSPLPMAAMSDIGEALAETPDLQITSIRWDLVESAPDIDYMAMYGIMPTVTGNEATRFTQAVLEDRTSLKILISGVAFSPNSYRQAQEQVLNFAAALGRNPDATVTPLKMPTDVRSDTSVSTTVNDQELRAEFSLELKLEVVQ